MGCPVYDSVCLTTSVDQSHYIVAAYIALYCQRVFGRICGEGHAT